jgi:glutamyl-tRNA synthetase
MLLLAGIATNDTELLKVIGMVKERCTLLPDFILQSSFFFVRPKEFDHDAIRGKWNEEKAGFFRELTMLFQTIENWDASLIESTFKVLALEKNIKAGELLFLFRMMLVGGKFGPPVFDIAAMLHRDETIARINQALNLFSN